MIKSFTATFLCLLLSATMSYSADTKGSDLPVITPVGTDTIIVIDDPGGTSATSQATIDSVGVLLGTDTATQPGDAVTTLDGTAHRILYVDASGNVTELALGADGTYLESNGATSAPSFTTPDGSAQFTPENNTLAGFNGSGTAVTYGTGDTLPFGFDIYQSDGTITFGGVDGVNNENLIYDFETTENTVGVSSSEGVTTVDYGTIGVDANTLTVNSTDVVDDDDIGVTVQAYDADLVVDAIEFVIDGGGSAITTGTYGPLEAPWAATINRATVLCDQSGSIVIDVWKDTYANYPPTDADSITASAVPTVSTATKSQDSTLTGWTTSITAGDIFYFNVDSATTVETCTISLKVAK